MHFILDTTLILFNCFLFFSFQPSVLALALLRQEIEAVQSEDMLEITSHIQRHLKVGCCQTVHDFITQQLIRGGEGVQIMGKKNLRNRFSTPKSTTQSRWISEEMRSLN